jgi:hypothetical protein
MNPHFLMVLTRMTYRFNHGFSQTRGIPFALYLTGGSFGKLEREDVLPKRCWLHPALRVGSSILYPVLQ